MRETNKKAISDIFEEIEKISKSFQILEMEGGDKFYFEFKDTKLNLNLIFDGSLLNIEYGKYLPILNDGKYTKWTQETLIVMNVIAKVNTIILNNNISKKVIKEYIYEIYEMQNKIAMDTSHKNAS